MCRSPDCKNLDGSNTKINKTEKNHTDKSKGNIPTLEEKFSQYGRFKNVIMSAPGERPGCCLLIMSM